MNLKFITFCLFVTFVSAIESLNNCVTYTAEEYVEMNYQLYIKKDEYDRERRLFGLIFALLPFVSLAIVKRLCK
jgi:hypothetical protein